MKDTTRHIKHDDDNIIDAIGSFECQFQSDEYIRDYRMWRKKKNNPYGFDFVEDTTVLAYMDGVGFINKKPDVEESKCLKKNMFVIGIAFCIYYIIETFGFMAVAMLTTFFGYPNTATLFTGYSTFSPEAAALIKSVIDILKFLIPIFVIKNTIKLPASVYFPRKIMNADAFKVSLPMTMISCAMGFILTYFMGVMLGFFSVNMNVPRIYFIEGNIPVSAVVAVSIIVINAFLYEILFNGLIMQGLRQFGDGFALLFSAIAATMMVHDISQSACTFIVTLTISYCVMCTGSLTVGIMMRVFYNFTCYASIMLSSYLPSSYANIVTYSTILLYLIVGIVWLVALSKRMDNVMLYKFHRTYMKLEEKFTIALVTGIMLVWLVLTFILTTVSINSAYII
ncbi:MAG: CPBP family intramembrane metalloprotease [Ruminococcus sp.]|nr:CPBP family intramembrane metalloprotease [Ruminococcus sp.]